MKLDQRLSEDLKAALRAGDNLRRETIRLLRAALHNERIERGRDLTEEEEAAVLRRQIKQRHESISEFQRGGRDDLAGREQAELLILQEYQPPQLSPDEIAQHVHQAVRETGAQGPRDQGKVMQWLAPVLRGRADLGEVSKLVQRELAERG